MNLPRLDDSRKAFNEITQLDVTLFTSSESTFVCAFSPRLIKTSLFKNG